MANGQGGMRRPQNPAPVSGPGQLSRRTDGGPQQVQAEMSGMPYGENMEFEAIQSSAPMSASPSAASPRARQRSAGAAGRQAAGMGATPLFAPTQRPDEPVTAGAPFGPGPGPMATQRENMRQIGIRDAQSIVESLPALEQAANSEFGTDSFRQFVQYVKSVAG
jgi:hypothetical protein